MILVPRLIAKVLISKDPPRIELRGDLPWRHGHVLRPAAVAVASVARPKDIRGVTEEHNELGFGRKLVIPGNKFKKCEKPFVWFVFRLDGWEINFYIYYEFTILFGESMWSSCWTLRKCMKNATCKAATLQTNDVCWPKHNWCVL